MRISVFTDYFRALLRPGRFDIEVNVLPPDADGREEIFRLYLSKISASKGKFIILYTLINTRFFMLKFLGSQCFPLSRNLSKLMWEKRPSWLGSSNIGDIEVG